MYMKSEHGEIEVFLCPEDDPLSSSSSSSPHSRPPSGRSSPTSLKMRNHRKKGSRVITQFIDEDDAGFQLETMDQNQPNCDTGIDISSMATSGSEPFLSLEPPLSENYTFTMDDGEGISNLFDFSF